MLIILLVIVPRYDLHSLLHYLVCQVAWLHWPASFSLGSVVEVLIVSLSEGLRLLELWELDEHLLFYAWVIAYGLGGVHQVASAQHRLWDNDFVAEIKLLQAVIRADHWRNWHCKVSCIWVVAFVSVRGVDGVLLVIGKVGTWIFLEAVLLVEIFRVELPWFLASQVIGAASHRFPLHAGLAVILDRLPLGSPSPHFSIEY